MEELGMVELRMENGWRQQLAAFFRRLGGFGRHDRLADDVH
jgi:hypothetical protein